SHPSLGAPKPRHFTPSGAVGDTGHRRAPPAITGRRRPPPAATGHRLLQSCGLSGPIPTTSQSSTGPPATPPALPRRRPPRQPCHADGHPASPATPTAASPAPSSPLGSIPLTAPLPTALMSAYRASQDTRRASASRPADTGRAAADRPALISMRSAMTLYARPGAEGAKVTVNSRYENYMSGQCVPPAQGEYFETPPPATDFDGAISIANDTLYGLGADVWSRQQNIAYRAGRAIQAGRAWVNNYQPHPVRATFGGYPSSGIGRENDLMMLDDSQQSKNLLVSYSESALGVV